MKQEPSGHDRRSFLKSAAFGALLPAVTSAVRPAPLIEKTPFFRIREAIICPTGRTEQFTEFSWTNFENWPDERIRRYPHFLKVCGFNSIQLAEIRGYCGKRQTQDLARVASVIRILSDEARSLGMRVSQFIWGQCLFHEGESLCWNDRREREWMETEFTRLAQTYANLADHIVLHYSDPGGCNRNGCDSYRTPQEISVAILDKYRQVNPSISASLSTWANQSFFDGYPGMGELLDETFCPRHLGIALHRWYDAEKARLVRKAGRKVGIWSWYIADYEMATDCTFGMKVMDRHFTSLPGKASEEVDWVSMERCWHGMPSDINLWVAGQKLIDPYRSLHEIEGEFCTRVFGDRDAATLLDAFHLCEAGQVDQRIYGYFIPEDERYPAFVETADFRKEAGEVLTQMERVSNSFSPQLALVTPPESMISFLKGRLRLLSSYSQALEKGAKDLDGVKGDPLYWSLLRRLAGEKTGGHTVDTD